MKKRSKPKAKAKVKLLTVGIDKLVSMEQREWQARQLLKLLKRQRRERLRLPEPPKNGSRGFAIVGDNLYCYALNHGDGDGVVDDETAAKWFTKQKRRIVKIYDGVHWPTKHAPEKLFLIRGVISEKRTGIDGHPQLLP